ncbi:MAG: ankyrin repeat domain-containing protein [candidate division NC10 bacterium]
MHAKDRDGRTALMQAAWHGHTAIVQILKEAGARE